MPEDRSRSMTPSSLSVAFHIGVHKTATTHLQLSLKSAADALAADGVRYHGPDRFRMPGHSIPALFGFRPGQGRQIAKRPPRDQLATLAKDADRLLLSEENFIGALNHPKGNAMHIRYKPAGPRLGAFAASIAQDVDVLMAVRRPTAFLNSAYCQYLMGEQVMSVDTYQARNTLESVDWLDLVQRIRATPGIGRLIVWRHEDYAALFPQIIAKMVGVTAAAHVVPVERFVHRGLSAAAVAEILHRTDFAEKEGFSTVTRKLLSVEAGYPAFDGFIAEEHARGDAQYADQIAQIDALPGVTRLCPRAD